MEQRESEEYGVEQRKNVCSIESSGWGLWERRKVLVGAKKTEEELNFRCKFCEREGTVTMVPGRGVTETELCTSKNRPNEIFFGIR
ncbi:uncharacterized protein LOC116195523 isoform X4 [Punica granatum]|uniref:Uncharacterized protein LOC116195523 isoform X4 n=1 Tax=Punica granatum TaxID=22663 RepID=A0A6P8CCA6_PUNGR|nr:uncharacterized protein LOC116195523 isoform X4 [Punica granatum]